MTMTAEQLPELGLLMRLDQVWNDGVGWMGTFGKTDNHWMATFFGKPDTHGNNISFPIGQEHVEQLEVGKQYLFVLVEKR